MIARIFAKEKTRAMATKLTLTVDKDIIESAKAYARKNGRSLSALIENYLRALTKEEDSIEALSPKVQKLLGSVKVPEDFDYKKEIEAELIKKYTR
jgi:hypothetical protein